ncbi:MAG: winged helix-turn-helix domain-containing protein [Armatimonas sp.]
MNAPCYIELFGGLCLRQADRPIVRFRTYKTAALLAYLAFHSGKPHSREVLANLFWPEGEDGRLSLRVAIGSLRRQLEPPGTPYGSVLIASRSSVQLNSAAIRTDVSEFEAALREAARAPTNERAWKLRNAVELYRGEAATRLLRRVDCPSARAPGKCLPGCPTPVRVAQ